MAEDLQQLLNRINDDYLKEAAARRDALIADAEKEAAKIIADAEAKAAAREAEAETRAAGFQSRAEAAARQAARDVILSLQSELQNRMARVLGENAAAAFTPDFMAEIIRDLAKTMLESPESDITVLVANKDKERLAEALKGSLRESFKNEARLFASAGVRSGMQVGFNGSDVFFDFSAEAVKELLCKYLGAELGRILDGSGK